MICSIYLIPFSSRTFKISSSSEAIVMNAVNAIFFTIPMACPSGVSEGQIVPNCVLCRNLGFTSFKLLSIGAFILLKYEIVDK